MEKKLVIYLLLCGYFLTSIGQNLWAKEPAPSQLKALKALGNISEDKISITWSNAGTPSFLTGKFVVEREGKTTIEVALSFLNQYRKLFRLKDALQEFKVNKVEKDDINFEHVRLKQYYQEVPVYGGELIVHFNPEGKITTVNGSYLPDINISFTPTIPAEQAITIARQDLNVDSEYYQGEGETKLEVYPFEENYFLVWHTVLLVSGPEPGNWEYFVDAHNGKIVHKFNSLMFDGPTTGSGIGVLGDTKSLNTYLSFGIYYLFDTTKPMFNSSNGVIKTTYVDVNYIYFDWDNMWDYNSDTSCGGYGGPYNQNAEVDAHYYMGKVYDYFYNVHGRNSYDGNGSNLIGIAHYDYCLNNAFWDFVTKRMLFGDGDGTMFRPVAGALDIVAHEVTHGVTGSTANLVYEYQSGALNESFSDVFGAMTEFYYSGAGGDWLIGEDVYTPTTPGDALRSMADPTFGGAFNPCNCQTFFGTNNQPDHMDKYINLPLSPIIYCGDKTLLNNDNGGVHINSGIPNKAAYLIAQAIGRAPTERIYYRALTQYLTLTSKFASARVALLQACSDLYGTTDGKYTAIKNAFDAVGILEQKTYYTQSLITNEFVGGGVAQGWKADEVIWSYNLPFAFPFFGRNYTRVEVSSNGFLSLRCYTIAGPDNTPTEFPRTMMIAPLWDDLRTDGIAQSGEDIYIHQPTSNSICFRWKAETYTGGYPVNIEIVLYNDGRIKFNYGSGNTNLSPTVGISRGDEAIYSLSSYNGQPTLTNSATVLFAPIGTPTTTTTTTFSTTTTTVPVTGCEPCVGENRGITFSTTCNTFSFAITGESGHRTENLNYTRDGKGRIIYVCGTVTYDNSGKTYCVEINVTRGSFCISTVQGIAKQVSGITTTTTIPTTTTTVPSTTTTTVPTTTTTVPITTTTTVPTTTTTTVTTTSNTTTTTICGSLTGKVRNRYTKEPLNGARVRIIRPANEVSETTTGEKGMFRFDKCLTVGTKYIIKAEKDGYYSQKKKVTAVGGENKRIFNLVAITTTTTTSTTTSTTTTTTFP